jgi:predicted DNA-binding transcriptional regulator AlpA
VIDRSLVAGDIVFNTHRDRAWYLGKSAGVRAQWLKENAGKWRRIQDVQQDVAPPRPLVDSKIKVRAAPTVLSSTASFRDIRNDGNDVDGGLVGMPAGDCSPPHQPAPTMVPPMIDAPLAASIAETKIEIAGRQYATLAGLASILGVSVRTLSRWDAAGIGPPKIKIGKLVLFDLSKLPEWLASRETRPAAAAGRNTAGGSYD